MTDVGICIQAGGRGTRLRPLLGGRTKALAPIGEITLLEHQIELARRVGPASIVVIGHDGAESIRALLPADILLLEEASPLDTAGGLALLPASPETWLVVNVDHISDVDWPSLVAAHEGAATAVVYGQRHEVPEGVVTVLDGRIQSYHERPVLSIDVTVGLYVFSRSALSRVLLGQRCSMPELINSLIPEGVHAWLHEGFWIDAGTPDRLKRAADWLVSRERATQGS